MGKSEGFGPEVSWSFAPTSEHAAGPPLRSGPLHWGDLGGVRVEFLHQERKWNRDVDVNGLCSSGRRVDLLSTRETGRAMVWLI